MAELSSWLMSGTLPHPRTRFFGRDDERRAAETALLDDASPLLTLTGTGGVGKTRLALAIAWDVAEAFRDGIVWIDLAPLTTFDQILAALANAFRFNPIPDRPLDVQLGSFLRERQLLLVIDNCEHVLNAVAEISGHLLVACPALQILATSRAPLHMWMERVLPVEPFPMPTDDAAPTETVGENPAVALFFDRARAVHPSFGLDERNALPVAALCRHLEGLPLAIELAAARSNVLPVGELLKRLELRLPLLTGGRARPSRQQTMGDAIAWSYDLLDSEAQALFRRLAIFVGGFTLEAAAAVAGGRDGLVCDVLRELTALVDHNLVRRIDGAGDRDQPRFTMLETIREFGWRELMSHGEEAIARTDHADYFLTLIHALSAGVAPHVPGADRVLERLNEEHPNLRAALNWFATTGASEEFVLMAGLLHAFWLHFGYVHEGRQWLERAVALEGRAPAPARVWAMVGLFAMLQHQQVEEPRALALIDEAVALARASGDPLCLGIATLWRHAADLRQERISEAEFARAKRFLTEARGAFASLLPAPWVARNLTHIDCWGFAYLALIRGDIADAEARAYAVLARQRALEREHVAIYPYVNRPQTLLGHVARLRGEHLSALRHYQGALRDAAQSGEVRGAVFALGGIAGSLAGAGHWTDAARLFGATEAACARAGIGFSGYVFTWQRAIGLPEPWLQAGASFGIAARLRSAAQDQAPRELPPLPDPAAADRLWADGRKVPLPEAIAIGLAVDLNAPAFLDLNTRPNVPPAVNPFGLTPREHEVLALLCQRLSDAEIGEALFISPRTASRHVANLFNKLDVGSRREAAAIAVSHNLV